MKLTVNVDEKQPEPTGPPPDQLIEAFEALAMITVTLEQLREYAMAQPDERPINFYDNHNIHPCGCLMVHYGREYLPEFGVCGFWGWGDPLLDAEDVALLADGRDIRDLVPFEMWSDIRTYGQLKQHLRSKYLRSKYLRSNVSETQGEQT